MDENRSHRPGLTPEEAKAFTEMNSEERVIFLQARNADITSQAKDRTHRLIMTDPTVKCAFCSKIVTVEKATERGWVPSFYTLSDIEDGACCPTCVETHLTKAADGEWVQRRTPLITLAEMTVGRLIQILSRFEEAAVVKISADGGMPGYYNVGEIYHIDWKEKYFHNPVVIEVKD